MVANGQSVMSEYELIVILLDGAHRAEVSIVGLSVERTAFHIQIQSELGCMTFGYDGWHRVTSERMIEIVNNTMVSWDSPYDYKLDCY